MAIAEFTSKAYTFTTTPKQAEFLETLDNKAQFIRDAIQEKMDGDNHVWEATYNEDENSLDLNDKK